MKVNQGTLTDTYLLLVPEFILKMLTKGIKIRGYALFSRPNGPLPFPFPIFPLSLLKSSQQFFALLGGGESVPSLVWKLKLLSSQFAVALHVCSI